MLNINECHEKTFHMDIQHYLKVNARFMILLLTATNESFSKPNGYLLSSITTQLIHLKKKEKIKYALNTKGEVYCIQATHF